MAGTVPPTEPQWLDPSRLFEDDTEDGGEEFSVGKGGRYKPKRMLPKRPKAPPQPPQPEAQDHSNAGARR